MAPPKYFCALVILSEHIPYSQLHLNYKECPLYLLVNICIFKADLYCSLNQRQILILNLEI